MIASLAWYPAARPAWERLWDAVRHHVGIGPERLTWPEDFDAHWRAPDLLLSMTCALPMQRGLGTVLKVVGSPVWNLPGLPAGRYASHLVTHVGDARSLEEAAADGLAVNAMDSQSGYGALRTAGLSGPIRVTGSHAASMQAVASGAAGLAAIDVVTWTQCAHPDVCIRATTPPTPACPFVTALPDMAEPLRHALRRAIAVQSKGDRGATRLSGITTLPKDSYAALPLGPHCNRSEFPA
ncbi:MAG: PhnD/SsuA/transferrin family substrate-binding protein [Jannaschia sp.]